MKSKKERIECGVTNHEYAIDVNEFGEYQTPYPPGSFAYNIIRFNGEINGHSISDPELVSFIEKDENYTYIYVVNVTGNQYQYVENKEYSINIF